jgi:hypothetical protein
MNVTGERGQYVNIDTGESFRFIREKATRTRDKEGTELVPVKMRHRI